MHASKHEKCNRRELFIVASAVLMCSEVVCLVRLVRECFAYLNYELYFCENVSGPRCLLIKKRRKTEFEERGNPTARKEIATTCRFPVDPRVMQVD